MYQLIEGEEMKTFYLSESFQRRQIMLSVICYNCLPHVHKDRFFPLLPLHFLFSSVSQATDGLLT